MSGRAAIVVTIARGSSPQLYPIIWDERKNVLRMASISMVSNILILHAGSRIIAPAHIYAHRPAQYHVRSEKSILHTMSDTR